MYSLSEKLSCRREEYRRKYKSKLKRLRKGKSLASVVKAPCVEISQSTNVGSEIQSVEKSHNRVDMSQSVEDGSQKAEGESQKTEEELHGSGKEILSGINCQKVASLEPVSQSLESPDLVSLMESNVSISDNDLMEDCEIDVVSISPTFIDQPVGTRPNLSFSIDSILYGSRRDERQLSILDESDEVIEQTSAFKFVAGTSGLSKLRRKSVMYIDAYSF